mmetsp:Transcript_56834/g.164658  ORF Transcript_56834/g.164658 Transcript_56834/m.164658 type:complete len:361 (+) Transcript_56834:553-1635(+)
MWRHRLVERETHEAPPKAFFALAFQCLPAQKGAVHLQLRERDEADASFKRCFGIGQIGMPMAVTLLRGQGVDGAIAGIGHRHAPRSGEGSASPHHLAIDIHCRLRRDVELKAQLPDECQAQQHDLVARQLHMPASTERHRGVIDGCVDEPREQIAAIRTLHTDHAILFTGVTESCIEAGLLHLALDPPPIVHEGRAARSNIKLVLCQLREGEVCFYAAALVTQGGVRDCADWSAVVHARGANPVRGFHGFGPLEEELAEIRLVENGHSVPSGPAFFRHAAGALPPAERALTLDQLVVRVIRMRGRRGPGKPAHGALISGIEVVVFARDADAHGGLKPARALEALAALVDASFGEQHIVEC